MSDFRTLTETMMVAPQIALEDLADAKAANVTLVINNRPDGEEPGAPQSVEMESAASDQGMAYLHIPVGHSGISAAQIDTMAEALANADGSVLAYCRSGTRSTMLWALAQAKAGKKPDEIASAAYQAGYDVAPIRPMLDMLSGQAG